MPPKQPPPPPLKGKHAPRPKKTDSSGLYAFFANNKDYKITAGGETGNPACMCSDAANKGEEVSSKLKPPSMEKGGKVKKTGLHLLHKGEVVIPAKEAKKKKNEGFIQEALSAKGKKGKPRGAGTLTEQAKREGKSVKEFAKMVDKNPSKYNEITKQRVNLYKNLMKSKK